jgi:hypothetical protein
MKTLQCLLFAVAAGAAAWLAVPAAQAAKGSCVLAGGEATMVTEDLAKFMAEAALKNSISGMGAKPAGKISMKCSTTTLAMTSCTAKQRACK